MPSLVWHKQANQATPKLVHQCCPVHWNTRIFSRNWIETVQEVQLWCSRTLTTRNLSPNPPQMLYQNQSSPSDLREPPVFLLMTLTNSARPSNFQSWPMPILLQLNERPENRQAPEFGFDKGLVGLQPPSWSKSSKQMLKSQQRASSRQFVTQRLIDFQQQQQGTVLWWDMSVTHVLLCQNGLLLPPFYCSLFTPLQLLWDDFKQICWLLKMGRYCPGGG